ncbi:hypothetical protein ABVK25_010597 [Lepraria finkii]|uniref:DUF7580 domain-containing protein n=1 Tax=Lepraria finkii TaxID=1340010 RepID=A0ABR4ATZ2_9LECA
MSGIEAVGLVLAVAPLLMSGLEHSQKGAHSIKVFFRKPEELKKFCHALGDQTTLLRLSIKELFGDIDGLLLEQVQALQDDDDNLSILWTDKTLIAKVEDNLGSSSAYRSYVGNIERVKAALETLVRKDRSFHLLSPEKTTRDGLQSLLDGHRTNAWSPGEILERIRFSSRDGRRQKLLNEIKECNDYLGQFMARNQELKHTTKTWRKRLADPMHQIRECASVLHSILSRAWRCSCQTPHNAKLRLEKRDPDSALSEKIDFRILFSRSAHGSSHSSLWQWQETVIRIPPKSPQVRPKGRVNFALPSPQLGPQMPNLGTLAEVNDICEAISTAQAHMHCLGFILDEHQKLRGTYQALRAWDNSSPTSREVVSLEVLLTRKLQSAVPSTKDDAHRLTKKERLILAVNLASSLLQLHTTPWLNERWTKKDIVFLKRDTSAAIKTQSRPPRPFNATEPFVSHAFLSCFGPVQAQNPQSSILPAPIHGNLNLLALGIILLELYFGESIESRRQPEDLLNGCVNSSTHLNVARRWLLECHQQEMSNGYWMATNHCIHCFFDPMPKSTDLHDEDFRESVYQKIVLPLEMELKQWQSTGP